MITTDPPPSSPVYQRLDTAWLNSVRRSGWQGWPLLAGGDNVMDQSVLFWVEGKGTHSTLNLTLRLRRDRDRHVRDFLSELPGVDIFRGSIPYPRKQVVAGEVHPLDRQWLLVAGTALEVQVDPTTRIRYFPYEAVEDCCDATPFSAQGSLTMVRERSQCHIEEVFSMLITLWNLLGIDTRLSTVSDLEYLYLRKVAWAMHLDGEEMEAALLPLEAGAEARAAALRSWVSTRLGVEDVAAFACYDWRPQFCTAYNPWAAAVGTGEAGWPHWNRFDMEAALQGPLGQVFLGTDLGEQAPHIGDRIARIVRSIGCVLSSEERWMRLGTPSRSIFQAPSQAEAGTFVPTRLVRHVDETTLIFHPHLLRRVDHIAVHPDAGNEGLSPRVLAERIHLETCSTVPPCSVYFKRGISLLDSLVRINLDHEVDRTRVLDAFRNVGVRRIRGIPVEDVVHLRHAQSTTAPFLALTSMPLGGPPPAPVASTAAPPQRVSA